MDQNLTDITLVIDRSGSMASCKNDAEGGINTFVEEQKKAPGSAVLSLVQFDTDYEFVHRAKPIAEVPAYSLVPRGSTALLDAVGKAIAETGERLKGIAEDQRPGLVVFVIVTDGEENASREYTKASVKEAIERQQNEYKWQFTFLGANQDAFTEAGAIGIARSHAANYSPARSAQAYQATSSSVKRMRSAVASGASADEVKLCASYTDDERKSMS